MSIPKATALAAGLAASLLAGGVAVAAGGGSASAHASGDRPTPDHASAKTTTSLSSSSASRPEGEGLASMSSPVEPGRPHVPADVLLVLGPGGSAGGARYVGPAGSMFNGPATDVDARVDAWWAAQMAAGVTPKEANRKLADLRG